MKVVKSLFIKKTKNQRIMNLHNRIKHKAQMMRKSLRAKTLKVKNLAQNKMATMMNKKKSSGNSIDECFSSQESCSSTQHGFAVPPSFITFTLFEIAQSQKKDLWQMISS